MWEQLDGILRQAASRVAEQVAAALPNVLAALVLLLATLVVAVAARLVLARVLRSLELDRHAERWGLTALGVTALTRPSLVVARAGQWAVLLLGGLLSLTALDAALPSRLAESVFAYVPHLLAALVIVITGTVVAQFLAHSVLIGAVNMQLPFARMLSLSVKWMVILVTVAMALDHLRIGRTILVLAFGIIFGGIVLATALAVGFGARDAVGRAIERQVRESAGDDDTLDHV
jgi:hypothetical protein